jgi:Domain of unknown function (DUF4279)
MLGGAALGRFHADVGSTLSPCVEAANAAGWIRMPHEGDDVCKPHEYKASLRLFSTTLRLDDLTFALGPPSKGHDIGDPVSSRYPDGAKRKRAHWGLTSERPPTDPLHLHIVDLLDFVEARADVLTRLRPKLDQIDVFCGVFSSDAQGGWHFDLEIMRRLVVAELEVGFDLY